MKILNSQFIKYCLVGCLNTGITLSVIAILLFLNVNYLLANIIGYALGTINSFIWNKQFTFRSNGGWTTEFIQFITLILITYIIQLSIVFTSVEKLLISEFTSQLIGMGFYTIIFYLCCKWIIFRR